MCVYDVYGPCSCPHGRCFTIMTQCFTIGAFITSVMAITGCAAMYVRPIPEEGLPEAPRVGFGFISREVAVLEPANYQGCVFYSQDEMGDYFDGDSVWRAGKAMSMMATGVGFIVMSTIMCTCCVAFQLPTFDGLFWTCMFCFVAQALTFLSWGSQLCDDLECSWSSGSGMNITASLMWVWAGNMIKSFPEALPPRGRGRRKAKPYEDDDNMGGEDTPYMNRRSRDVYQDEYDDDAQEDVVDFQDDNQYHDDGYDEGYDDGAYEDGYEDGYDDQGYAQEEGYDDDGQGYVDPYAPDGNDTYPEDGQYEPAFPQDTYETDYEEPENSNSDRDNEFEPNAEFQNSWKGNEMESEEFDAPDANYFQQPTGNDNQELSKEEMEYLGTDQGYNKDE